MLTVLYGAGWIAGQLIGPTAHGGDAEAMGGHGEMAEHGGPADPLRGLAVAEHGLRLVVDTPELRRGHTQQVRFRVLDERGEPVRDFDVEHTRRMHLIVASRDLSSFQHLHPEMAADGTWSVALRLAAAGSQRLFADFSHGGEATTLASDLRVDGPADLRPLPAAAQLARSDLGAGGHLVALREGDLAFLHVHPVTAADAGGPQRFMATFPTPGRYRLFLQVQDAGRVHTVASTQVVG